MSDKLAVLGTLEKEDLYGYQIAKKMSEVEGFWYIFPGNLYRALSSLENEKLIEAKETEEHAGRLRKVYTITEEGRKVYDEWISKPADPPKTRYEAFLKIWLARGDSDLIRIQLEQIRDYSSRMLELMKSVQDSSAEFPAWIFEGAIKHFEVDLQWSIDSLKKLPNIDKKGR